jgi:membrane protease YdiL (CAAX protease family)
LPVLIFILDIVISFSLGVFLLVEEGLEEVDPSAIPILSLGFIPFLLLLSFIEEMIFRILPLTFVMRATERQSLRLAAAVATAVAFGYYHGGLINIVLQGVGGLLYAIVFIKYAHNERYGEAGLVVIMLHTFFNGVVALVLLLAGETMF